jgi:hypothetical protein
MVQPGVTIMTQSIASGACLNDSFVFISETDDGRIWEAKQALKALSDLTLSAANIATQVHTPHQKHLEVDPMGMSCLLSMIAERLTYQTQFLPTELAKQAGGVK